MSIFTYALLTYGLTALISFAVIGIIVLISRLLTHSKKLEEDN